MELVHRRCAGLDVSKRDTKVYVRVGGSGRAAATSTVSRSIVVTLSRISRDLGPLCY